MWCGGVNLCIIEKTVIRVKNGIDERVIDIWNSIPIGWEYKVLKFHFEKNEGGLFKYDVDKLYYNDKEDW